MDETLTPVVVVSGFVVLVIGFIGLALYLERKRTTAMLRIAQQLGLDFLPDAGSELVTEHEHLPLFQRGRNKRAKNLLLGELQGVQVRIFDYRYTTGRGKKNQTWNQTVMSIASEHMDLPDFTVSPENVFHKIGSAFGYQDVDFASHRKFSKRFLLRGSDEEAIRQLFVPPVIEWFERHRGVTAEAFGDMFVFFRAVKRAQPETIPDFIKDGLSLFKQLVGR